MFKKTVLFFVMTSLFCSPIIQAHSAVPAESLVVDITKKITEHSVLAASIITAAVMMTGFLGYLHLCKKSVAQEKCSKIIQSSPVVYQEPITYQQSPIEDVSYKITVPVQATKVIASNSNAHKTVEAAPVVIAESVISPIVETPQVNPSCFVKVQNQGACDLQMNIITSETNYSYTVNPQHVAYSYS